MIKLIHILLLTLSLIIAYTPAHAEEKEVTTVTLKYIVGEDVLSVLNSLIDDSVSLSFSNNLLVINGTANKTKSILHIIKEIDTPPSTLKIEFIASNRKIDFKQTANTYQSGKNVSNTSQSMSITERQWVSLNTGLSVPIAQRKRYADGTESQSFKYKKISKNYIFKVHEFGGWSVVQVGLNVSTPSSDIAGAIEHTKLDTTIIGKTDEWLEVASSKEISKKDNSKTYSTNTRPSKKHIFLYVKIKKPEAKVEQQPKVIK